MLKFVGPVSASDVLFIRIVCPWNQMHLREEWCKVTNFYQKGSQAMIQEVKIFTNPVRTLGWSSNIPLSNMKQNPSATLSHQFPINSLQNLFNLAFEEYSTSSHRVAGKEEIKWYEKAYSISITNMTRQQERKSMSNRKMIQEISSSENLSIICKLYMIIVIERHVQIWWFQHSIMQL